MIARMRYSSTAQNDGTHKLTADAKDGSLTGQLVVSTKKWSPDTVATLLRRWAEVVEESGGVEESGVGGLPQ